MVKHNKGIFPTPGFGRVPANRTINAQSGELSDKTAPLYYGNECVNAFDYLAYNAVLSELFNTIKDVKQYNPAELNNLLIAIKELIKKYSFYPNNPFDVDIKTHDPCNETAEIVLVEKEEIDGHARNILSKISVQDLLQINNKTFDITKFYHPSLVAYDSSQEDQSKERRLVTEAKHVVDGKIQNRLETINFDDLSFDLTRRYPKRLSQIEENDAKQGVVVSINEEDTKGRLKYIPFEELGKYFVDFDPTLTFVHELEQAKNCAALVGVARKDDRYKFVAVNYPDVSNDVLYKGIQNRYTERKQISTDLIRLEIMSVEDFKKTFSDQTTAKQYLQKNYDLLEKNVIISSGIPPITDITNLELSFSYIGYNYSSYIDGIGSFVNVLYSVEEPEEGQPIDYNKIDFKTVYSLPTQELPCGSGMFQHSRSYQIYSGVDMLSRIMVHKLYYIPQEKKALFGLYAPDDIGGKRYPSVEVTIKRLPTKKAGGF